ncbi:RagB/SusD family nutrient uptake outer membrane protein [Sphingobacterium olei]|uniref:RagB/SusD family nutrient uptake outer membrane protein n=1 Tax=Sphingobacterium olei TaxID=2571155 RepID=A0A4V5MN85_9SPHI|nr:RagB/SusD family nutrient uptake outer membrane protein [Sphingobacterium olei]TJZ60708.1 RagB/SusD family nutrient uptake outer membrane protein [Sphingobacterium olei]
MKVVNKIVIAFLAVCSFVLSGCEKFLEQEPDMRTTINSVEKVKALVSTAYPTGSYYTFMEAASDNAEDKGPLGSGVYAYEINRTPYMFEETTAETGTDSPTNYWNRAYQAIAAANHALHAIAENNFDAKVLPYKGEALVCRAYAHFMLVTLFARAYDPATADNYPGIPYVVEPGKVVQAQYDRKTISYVYDMIEKDLKEGLPLISDAAYEVPRFHFNVAAAHAFAARFYLFKKDYEKVVEHANKVAPSGNYQNSLREWISTYNSWETDQMRINYLRSNEPANLLLAQTTSWWGRRYYYYRFGLTFNLNRNLMSVANVTGKAWGQRTSSYSNSTNIRHNKFTEFFVYSTSGTGSARIMAPLLSAEEALFNRAEAYAYLGDYDKALEDLNLYASKRITSFNSTTDRVTYTKLENFYKTSDPREGIVKTILDFKRAEFVQEGLRWLDILRHKITVEHKVLDTDGVTVVQTITIDSDDPRRMFQLPPEVTLAGIEQNPRK